MHLCWRRAVACDRRAPQRGQVAGITLWLFGGVLRLEGEPTSARAEALIAGVGPLTSFVMRRSRCRRRDPPSNSLLSGLFGLVTFVKPGARAVQPRARLSLDGGRILSSLFGGAPEPAARRAQRGRVRTRLRLPDDRRGVLGCFSAAAEGAWMAILGWFLLSAGASEEAGSRSLAAPIGPVSAG